jgi:SRSO17 transposase
MDVELQILKHLKRDARSTVSIIDRYCSAYNDLFIEVRSYECFKYLHQGIISPIKRKSLPEIAKVVGISSSQSLHHFLANSPWSVEELKSRRLTLTREVLKGKKITVVIDETGDRKKGTKTDYVARQYLGSVGKIDRGMVSVNAYGVYKNITFPLICKVFKPKGTLKEGDTYQTKIELADKNSKTTINFTYHPQWNHQIGWKNALNNLRLIIQPSLLLWLIFPWLEVFPNSSLLLGLHRLINTMNQFHPKLFSG